MIVDLGCGNTKRGQVGIDMTDQATCADIICHLGFEPIPLPDNSAQRVLAHDSLAHVPFCVWENGRRRTLTVDLVSVWTQQTMTYGCGFEHLREPYGIRARFRVLRNEVVGIHLKAELEAVKPTGRGSG